MLPFVGRPRLKHKDLPKGFRLVDGRWYWRPTDTATAMAAQALINKGRRPPGFADKRAAREWWVKTIIPILDQVAPEQPADHGTFSELIQLYRQNGMSKRGGKALRPRTAVEYEKYLLVLEKAFGHRRYARSEAEAAIGDYIRKADIRRFLAEAKGPKLANRQIAAMSSIFRHGINAGRTEYNPCLTVERNAEVPRERYVENWEVEAVYNAGNKAVRDTIDWIYATLQRVEDVLRLGPAHIKRTDSGTRFLRVVQSKGGSICNIEITPEIDALIDRAREGTVVYQTFIRRQNGRPYANIDKAWQRARIKAGVKDFGPRDLRGKAATDMLASGVPMEHIQRLLGHADIATTKIYIKRYSAEPIRPTTSRITHAKKQVESQ